MTERSAAFWLTPPGRSAIATVAIVGPHAVAEVEGRFQSASGRRLSELPSGSLAFGRWGDEDGEELVVCVRPEGVEVHCHGGVAAAQAIIDSLADSIAFNPDSNAWLEHQFEDPFEREVYAALPHATTTQTAARLLAQAGGALRRHIEELAALRQANPEAARAAAETMLAESRFGLRLTTPWRVILTGPPNVGKSSLINRIVGYERTIVYDQPGTTRDVVSVSSPLAGWPVAWSDTAGIRESDDALEQAGVARAEAARAAADLVLHVFDASNSPVAATGPPPDRDSALWVANKMDLATSRDTPSHAFPVSAATGEGIEQLLTAVAARLVGDAPSAIDHPLLFTQRQIQQVRAIAS